MQTQTLAWWLLFAKVATNTLTDHLKGVLTGGGPLKSHSKVTETWQVPSSWCIVSHRTTMNSQRHLHWSNGEVSKKIYQSQPMNHGVVWDWQQRYFRWATQKQSKQRNNQSFLDVDRHIEEAKFFQRILFWTITNQESTKTRPSSTPWLISWCRCMITQ